MPAPLCLRLRAHGSGNTGLQPVATLQAKLSPGRPDTEFATAGPGPGPAHPPRSRQSHRATRQRGATRRRVRTEIGVTDGNQGDNTHDSDTETPGAWLTVLHSVKMVSRHPISASAFARSCWAAWRERSGCYTRDSPEAGPRGPPGPGGRGGPARRSETSPVPGTTVQRRERREQREPRPPDRLQQDSGRRRQSDKR